MANHPHSTNSPTNPLSYPGEVFGNPWMLLGFASKWNTGPQNNRGDSDWDEMKWTLSSHVPRVILEVLLTCKPILPFSSALNESTHLPYERKTMKWPLDKWLLLLLLLLSSSSSSSHAEEGVEVEPSPNHHPLHSSETETTIDMSEPLHLRTPCVICYVCPPSECVLLISNIISK